VQDRLLSERCLSNSEVPIIPFGIDDNVQIVQTPGSIMIFSDTVHDARIVRMNATHLPSNVAGRLHRPLGWRNTGGGHDEL